MNPDTNKDELAPLYSARVDKAQPFIDDDDLAADNLGELLLACQDDKALRDSVLLKSFDLLEGEEDADAQINNSMNFTKSEDDVATKGGCVMMLFASTGLAAIFVFFIFGKNFGSSRLQPVGPYVLTDKQEGKNFFSHYSFYDGSDSEGSKGFINYVQKEKAFGLSIANVTYESVDNDGHAETEPFIYMSTTPTVEGPRNSVRLEGRKRYNRGLFIIDVRHMPAGCGTWPAFWLSDEANWPVNGEIDMLEGVNTQSKTKTALHTTSTCRMDDVPLGVKTGVWDTAQGVPMHNGTLDMTLREANNCFVYDPHQWLNQGCVAMSSEGGTIGTPLNAKGGGVYALEWDPINRFIKSWVFTPHEEMPQNLKDTLRTANNAPASKRVAPDPTTWTLPYAYFPIGTGTNCPASHFQNMHIIFNTALCGSVAGNRFFLDCPDLNEKYGSCNEYVKANTPEMAEVYWKIRGVYIYQREWERSWA